jgi:hypothetical protein
MLIGRDFVMLHNPKTGSSFARKVLHAVYDLRARECGVEHQALIELLLPNIRVAGRAGTVDQHGTFSQIPDADKGKTVYSIARDPSSRAVSMYKFGYWRSFSPIPMEIIQKEFPGFPALTLKEYIDFENRAICFRTGFDLRKASVGFQTVQFIQMFFAQPNMTLQGLTDDFIDSDECADGCGQIHFLRQESLRRDLKQFLGDLGFGREHLRIVDETPDSNVSRWSGKASEVAVTPELESSLRHRERLIYRIYRNWGLNY